MIFRVQLHLYSEGEIIVKEINKFKIFKSRSQRKMASSSMLIMTPLLAVASLSLIVWSIPYDNKTHQDIQHQQRPNVAAVTAEKRTDKPYYSQLKFAISLLHSLQKNEPNKNIF